MTALHFIYIFQRGLFWLSGEAGGKLRVITDANLKRDPNFADLLFKVYCILKQFVGVRTVFFLYIT